MLFDDQKHRTRRILRVATVPTRRETDLLSGAGWHPTGQLIGIIRERKGFFGTHFYVWNRKVRRGNSPTSKRCLGSRIQTMVGPRWSPVCRRGRATFCLQPPDRTYFRVTKDLWDDLHPRFYKNSTAIVFSSNRNNDTPRCSRPSTLPTTTSIFSTTTTLEKPRCCGDWPARPMRMKSCPCRMIPRTLLTWSDENGIVNRYTAHLDSAIAHVDTVEHYRMIVDNFAQTDNRQEHPFAGPISAAGTLRRRKYRLLVNRKPQATAARTQLVRCCSAEEARKRPALADKPSVQKPGAEPANACDRAATTCR